MRFGSVCSGVEAASLAWEPLGGVTPLPKPARRAPKPPNVLRRSSPVRRGTKRIRTRRPLGTVRREAKAAGDLQPEQWEAIVRFYDGRCAYCDRVQLWPGCQQDHVKPLSKGGRHTASNVVPACPECNYRKGASVRWQPKRRHPFMEAE